LEIFALLGPFAGIAQFVKLKIYFQNGS